MNQNIITREQIREFKKGFLEARETGDMTEFIAGLQPKIAGHLEAYNINQIAIPLKKLPGAFTFIKCAHVIDDHNHESWLAGCKSTRVEPNPEMFKEYILDIEGIELLLQTIEQLEAHGIPSSEWHKAQELSVYYLLTRRQAMEIKRCLIKAKNDNDWKEYARQSTKIQKGIVAILESHGIRQIALKLKDRPGYNFIRIMNPDNLDGWGDCFLETCESENETPDPDDFMDSIETPDTLVEILDLIDRYKERGIPVSEWGKGHILN